ncbi:MAG: hypothetical protein QM504_07990 [Pseudomonadota bacterium]
MKEKTERNPRGGGSPSIIEGENKINRSIGLSNGEHLTVKKIGSGNASDGVRKCIAASKDFLLKRDIDSDAIGKPNCGNFVLELTTHQIYAMAQFAGIDIKSFSDDDKRSGMSQDAFTIVTNIAIDDENGGYKNHKLAIYASEYLEEGVMSLDEIIEYSIDGGDKKYSLDVPATDSYHSMAFDATKAYLELTGNNSSHVEIFICGESVGVFQNNEK